MKKKKPYTARDMADVSYNPEWTAEMVKNAKPFAEVFPDLAKTIRRGRPKKADAKKQVTLRLSPEVIDHFRAQGAGWQTRIDEALVKIARRKKAAA